MPSPIFNFCPKCGHKLDNSGKEPTCNSCGFIFYQNSKPCAGIFLLKGQQVLLCKRGRAPYIHEYDVVGGFLDHGELPETGIHREVQEELGVKVKIIELLGFYINNYGSKDVKTLDIFYVGKIVSGNPKSHDDIEALEWHPINKLPKTPMLSVTKALNDLPKWYRTHKSLLK